MGDSNLVQRDSTPLSQCKEQLVVTEEVLGNKHVSRATRQTSVAAKVSTTGYTLNIHGL